MSITKVSHRDLAHVDLSAVGEPIVPGSWVQLVGDFHFARGTVIGVVDGEATVLWARDPLVIKVQEIKAESRRLKTGWPVGQQSDWMPVLGTTLVNSCRTYDDNKGTVEIEEEFVCNNGSITHDDIEKIRKCAGVERVDVRVVNNQYGNNSVKLTVRRTGWS
jgi:hypothetical protein